MANYKNKKEKTVLSVIAIILALLLIASVTLGIGDHFYGWFDKTDEETVQTDEADNDGMVISSVAARGIELSLKSTASEVFVPELGVDDDEYDTSKYTVTATITPSTATNKDVTMSVAWANAGSDWASGKTVTDYVTIEQESEGSLTGTITCIEAFGEQVILTVTSDADSDISATATIDYLKRISTSFHVVNHSTGSTSTMSFGSTLDATFSCVFGTGTLVGDLSVGSLYYGISSSDYSTGMTCASVVSNYGVSLYYYASGSAITTNLSYSAYSTDTVTAYSCSLVITDIYDLISNYDELDEDSLSGYYDKWSSLGYMCIGFGTTYSYTYDGVEIDSGMCAASYNFEVPTVEAVALSYDSIVF